MSIYLQCLDFHYGFVLTKFYFNILKQVLCNSASISIFIMQYKTWSIEHEVHENAL